MLKLVGNIGIMLEIETLEALEIAIEKKHLSEVALQSLDLSEMEDKLLHVVFDKCIFLGCTFTPKLLERIHPYNYIFPHLDVPFHPYPSHLYTKETLYAHYDYTEPRSYNKTPDKLIYDHYLSEGKEAKNIQETLARRLHDHSITNALNGFLRNYKEKEVVAIMGGHGLSRESATYLAVCKISKALTERGYLMISGGGPGAMEATHLGAWLAGYPEEALLDAIEILSVAPSYKDKRWLATAYEVLEKYPKSHYKSLGVPTWLYGHEPATPFATHIAKYFANSVREEGLLAIAKGGVIYTPGSAGTMQEIFQDITQNHYLTFGYASPMVFWDKEYWSYDRPVYPLLELMSLRNNLENLDLGVYDEIEEVIAHIESFTTH